jgi:hypothetical protein
MVGEHGTERQGRRLRRKLARASRFHLMDMVAWVLCRSLRPIRTALPALQAARARLCNPGLLILTFCSPFVGAIAREAPPLPLEATEAFQIAAANGTLILPAGAPDRRSPAIVILQDGEAPDGRASQYTDQLLGAGFVVLELAQLQPDELGGVLTVLAMHPRVAGQPLGLLGFGQGARLAASVAQPVAARALLYPGCDGVVPAPMPGQAVLLMHGGADPANSPPPCEAFGVRLRHAGATLRWRVLPGASYAWDRPSFAGEGHAMLPRPDGAGRVRAEAWPALAALSAAEVAGFFALSLLGRLP